MPTAIKAGWKYFRLALGFLTTIPARVNDPFQPGDLGRAAAFYPLIGLIIGLILCAVRAVAARLFSEPLGAILVVAAWVVLTGGLHLDGLADCCDGLLAALPPGRRLEIMRDPRLGTFGGVGLILFLLLKTGAVLAIPSTINSWQMYFPLLFAPVLARGLLLLAARQPMARPGGLGAEFALGVTRRTYILAVLLPLALLGFGGLHGLAAAAAGLLVTLGIIHLAKNRLGGLTGDVLGLQIELVELTVLLVFAAAPA